jgi:hypothetical protein
MTLCIFIIPSEVISVATSEIPLISNTNTTASQFVEGIPFILHECLNRSSWNLVWISCTHSLINSTNTAACQIEEVIDYYATWYVYHVTWSHLRGVFRISLLSVVATLQRLKLLKQFYWMPNWSSSMLARMSCHLRPSKRYNPYIPLSVIPALKPHIFPRQNPNIAWKPLPVFMKLTYYIIPPKVTWMTYSIKPSHQ